MKILDEREPHVRVLLALFFPSCLLRLIQTERYQTPRPSLLAASPPFAPRHLERYEEVSESFCCFLFTPSRHRRSLLPTRADARWTCSVAIVFPFWGVRTLLEGSEPGSGRHSDLLAALIIISK